jgi:hypothetical protein
LIGPDQTDKNGGGDEVSLKQQICRKTNRAAEQQYANDAVDVETFHKMIFMFQNKDNWDTDEHGLTRIKKKFVSPSARKDT